MMQRTSLLVTLGLAATLATAQESALQLPSCESRCYKQTAEMKGCGETDYACACDGFNDKFYPQYSSCMIEGCAFDGAGISQQDLESMVCKAAGQSPSSSSSHASSSHPSGEDTTPAPTSSKATAATTAPGDGSASSSSSASSSIVSNNVPVPPGGNPSTPDETSSPSPTSVKGTAAGRLERVASWAWMLGGVFAYVLLAA